MSEKNLILIARFQANSGKEEALKELLTSLVAPTRQEAGCLHYELHQSVDNPQQFMFYEVWKNSDAHKAHCEMPYMKTWREKREGLLAGPGEFQRWEN